MKKIASYHIKSQTGVGFRVQKGNVIRIISPQAEQCSDFMCFAADDTHEWLSSGRSIDYNDTIRFTTGHTLYSNRSKPMVTIVEDTVKCHDFLLTPCSQEMFEKLYHVKGHHPSCFENLAKNLAPFGIKPDNIPTTLNVFMNVAVSPDGRVEVLPPPSKPGDHLDFHAEMDLIVGVTACSAEKSNNWTFKPIDVEVYEHN
ncbi:urea carboxylase-associated family protein [Candidatus Gottesmanbacteria bacterium]|nr:urea carboxylase-associated family protein [Candidatus Gottesmanbacteria bacterium]